MVAGTAVIMWFGELITGKGVGNGMSLLMFTSIAARLPSQGSGIQQAAGGVVFTLVLLLGLAIVVFVVFVEQAQRRIPVQYAKRMIGRRMYGGSSTYIPMKVNQAGVVPVIFASSLLQLPQLLGQVWTNKTFQDFEQRYLVRGDNPLYLVTYAALIIFFTYFYVAITFNPVEVADNMKKYGGFIPGIRPGRPTVRVPGAGAFADHASGLAVPRHHLRSAAGAAQPDEESAIPVRRHQRPDHGRCGPGDGEADRKPAAAA